MVRGPQKGTVRGIVVQSKTQCGDSVEISGVTEDTVRRHATRHNKQCGSRSEVRGVREQAVRSKVSDTRRDRRRSCRGTEKYEAR